MQTDRSCTCASMPILLGRDLATATEFDNRIEESIFECEEESGSKDTLGNLGADALVQTSIAFLADHTVKSLRHALLLARAARDVHLALNGDVGISHRRGEKLSQGAEEEGNGGSHFAALLDVVLHLLKESVLKNRIDDEYQGR